MTSRAQKAAARVMADRLIEISELETADAFSVSPAALTDDFRLVPERVARRVLDDFHHTLNPLLGPAGLRVTANRRPKVEVER